MSFANIFCQTVACLLTLFIVNVSLTSHNPERRTKKQAALWGGKFPKVQQLKKAQVPEWGATWAVWGSQLQWPFLDGCSFQRRAPVSQQSQPQGSLYQLLLWVTAWPDEMVQERGQGQGLGAGVSG